jgi:hypothetical protein
VNTLLIVNTMTKSTIHHDPQSNDLPLTANGIPISLRPCFQEYTLEKLDPERDAFTVIERTLARGDRRELRWLFARYGRERLAEWVRQTGWWRLSRRRFRFWLAYFDIHDYRRNPLGRGVWPY